MNVQQIPRTIVNRGLDAARFPIDTVARLAGGDERWTIAVDRLEAGVRETAGRVLGDETLVGDARLQRTEAAEREKALRLRLEAERAKREGERRAGAVEQRAAAEERAERRRAEQHEARIERREREAQKAAIRKKTAALDAKERALATKTTADRLEDAAKATKAKRKGT
jgi:hypothetical protein